VACPELAEGLSANGLGEFQIETLRGGKMNSLAYGVVVIEFDIEP
jgi:hypothetical protein